MQLSEVSQLLKIQVLRDGEFKSLGLIAHKLDRMLVGLYDPSYLEQVNSNPHIACVITTTANAEKLPEHIAIAVCEDPKTTFYQIHKHLFTKTNFYWNDFDSEISPDAIIHERAYVAPKNVRIGAGTIVEPNATILERSIIGQNVTIRAGAVIGGEGFEPKYLEGKHIIVPHSGGVRLHDGVEIQANSHVARSVLGGFTEIGENTKVDALVHIGHNVSIGARSKIGGCAGIGGSTVIGDDVWIGGNCSIFSEVRIGNHAFVVLGSVVRKDVAAYAMVNGSPARFVHWVEGYKPPENAENAE